MDDHLIDLETRLAFQEHALQELGKALYEHQRLIDQLTRRLETAEARLKAIAVSPVASAAEETPPPHY
jgi:Uncharacterized protein conserved in bacteria